MITGPPPKIYEVRHILQGNTGHRLCDDFWHGTRYDGMAGQMMIFYRLGWPRPVSGAELPRPGPVLI
jgi:hypothetical protein